MGESKNWRDCGARDADGFILITDDEGLVAAVTCADDARLIVAAPEMLEALKAVDLARHTDAPEDWVRATELSDAAIAKAEGR